MPPRKSWCHVICYKLVPLPPPSSKANTQVCVESLRLFTLAPFDFRPAERKAVTYARLAKVSGATELALVVKAADRLANVRCCVADQRRRLWEVYRNEHPCFRQAAYRDGLCEPLWTELDALLQVSPRMIAGRASGV